jgi:copper chaperone
MEELLVTIDGMTCGHCVGQVTRALTRLDGVSVNAVKVGEAVVTYDRLVIAAADIVQAINEAGYGAKQAGRAA